MRSRTFILAYSLIPFALSACNSTGSSSTPIDQPLTRTSPIPDPTPTVTSVPTPTPTIAPTPTPTPTATATPGALYSGPEEVSKFVSKFVDDAKIQGVDVTTTLKAHPLTIQLASLSTYGSSVIGLCEYTGTGRRVTFSPTFWNSVSDTQKELLAHHELGHCVLGRAHRNDTLSTGAYASIMYPIIMSANTYNANYDYYQNELYTWSASALNASSSTEDSTQDVRHICNGLE